VSRSAVEQFCWSGLVTTVGVIAIMTELLQQVIAEIKKLPADQQDAIALLPENNRNNIFGEILNCINEA
jgi:3-oxoacyl-(acyl-carrier-protein) synthase